MNRLITALLLASSFAIAQTAAPAIAPVNAAECPTVIVGIGGGVIRNSGQTSTGEGYISGLLNLGACNYIGTNVDMAQVNGLPANTVRAEYSRLFAFGKLPDGGAEWLVGPVVSAGTATTPPVIGSFAGGIYGAWNLGAIAKRMNGLMLTGEVRLTGSTQTVASSTTAANGVTTVTTVTTTPTNQVGQVSVGLYLGVSFTFR